MLFDLVLSTLGASPLGSTALGQTTCITTRDSDKSGDVSSYRVSYPPNDDDDDDDKKKMFFKSTQILEYNSLWVLCMCQNSYGFRAI